MTESFLPPDIQRLLKVQLEAINEPFERIERQRELAARLGQVTCEEDVPALGMVWSGEEAHALENLPCKRCGAAI